MNNRLLRAAVTLLCCIFLLSACNTDPNYDVILIRSTDGASASVTSETLFPVHSETAADDTEITVIVNRNSGTYHIDPACRYAVQIREENRLTIHADPQSLSRRGYTPCSVCAAAYRETFGSSDDTQTSSSEPPSEAQSAAVQ